MKLNWIALSLVAWLFLAILITLFTYLTKKGFSVAFLLFAISVIYSIAFGVQSLIFKQFPSSVPFNVALLIILLGVAGVIGNLAQFQALKIAPNPGLVISIVSTYAGFVAILAVIFFKNSLSLLQILGIILSIIAISLIRLGSK